MLLRIVSAVLLVVFVSFEAEAGRPLQTEDAATAGKGTLQLEVGFGYSHQREDGQESLSATVTPIFGIIDPVELSCDLPFAVLLREDGTRATGISDINVVLKTRFVEERRILPALLLKTFVKLATGDADDDLGSGSTDVGLVAVATKEIGDLTLHANIGYGFVTNRTRHDYLIYGIAMEYPLTERWSFASEAYVQGDNLNDIGSWEHHLLNPLVGFTWRAWKIGVIDMAMRMGVNINGIADYGPQAGLSLELF